MAFDLKGLRDRIKSHAKDQGLFIGPEQIDEVIASAIIQVDHDKPFSKKIDIAGDGTQDYDLTTEFQKGFSDIPSEEGVEMPSGETPPIFLDRQDDWFIYEDPSKVAAEQQRLRFIQSTPNVGETIRVEIQIPHVVTESTTTLDQDSFLATVYLSLVFIFRALAAHFSESLESTIGADSVDRAAQAQSFLFIAERFLTSYRNIVGIGKEVKAAQAFSEADIKFRSGADFFWNPKTLR